MSTAIGFREFFEARHRNGDLVVFPTGMGSEISALGAKLTPPYETRLPLWSGSALLDERGRELVRQVHLNAIQLGGTDIITTNTWARPTAFKCVADNWQAAAHDAFRHGVRIAVDVKKQIRRETGRNIYVGGSFGPLMDSHEYHAERALSMNDLLKTHRDTAQALVDAASNDLDFLIPETACSADEAWAMAWAASITNRPFILGLTPGVNGDLRDGTKLERIIADVSRMKGFTAIAFNCIETACVKNALNKIGFYEGPIVIYANGHGKPGADGTWQFDNSAEAVASFSETALSWAMREKNIVGLGGCCGTLSHSYGQHLNSTIQAERQRRFACQEVPRRHYAAG